MSAYRDHFETFELCGLTFAAYTERDDSMGAPWEEHDGHGDIRESRKESFTSRYQPGDKRPGERVLYADCGVFLLYDWAGTMKKARAEGWGLGDDARAALVERIAGRDALAAARAEGVARPFDRVPELLPRFTREPTRGEIVAEAVRLDFERLRAWANDEWHYVGVIVELLDVEGDETGEDESLWAIESDSPDYHAEVARELADQLIDRLGVADKRRKNLKREGAARSELIRVRA